MNVLLIVIDTLRADHLGCYGYSRNTSPNINALAREGTLCERMFAPAIPTHPAFTTINSGQYPITHMIVAHGGGSEVPRSVPWLPVLMQKNGYTTCACDNLADWRHGFGRGYEFYVDPTTKRPLGLSCDNRDINKRAIPWLENYGKEQFFMFIHYWDPHTPYFPPRAYRRLFYNGNESDPDNHSLDGMERHPLGKAWRDTWFPKLADHITDAEYIQALYDAEIRYCDEGIGQLMKALERLGIIDNTMIVLTADHGELMYRHGIFFDHHGLYDGNLHVPFVVKHPQLAPRRISPMAASVDIAPTILDLCGGDVPEKMEGRSLAPWMRGEAEEAVHDFVVSAECTWQMKWSIRTDRHKFILAREPDFYGTPMRELYDLESDPHELHNIAEADADTARRLEAMLEGWIQEKMTKNGLSEDPLVAHGITLGKNLRRTNDASA